MSVFLLLAALILSACQRAVVPGTALTPSAPTQAAGPEAFKSYTSSMYGYTVSYPGNWGIKIDTSVSASPGTNPEYITLYPGENMLPVVPIYALTGAAPITGYELCTQNFDFQGLKACRISQPGGQVSPSEILVFQKGDAHFQISMAYEDPVSKQVFDQMLSQFEFTK
jgi:hypothetical protein